MYARFIHYFIAFSQRHTKLIVALFLALGAGSTYFALQLKVNSDYAKLLPPAHPTVQHLNETAAKAGGTSYLAIYFESGTLEAKVALAAALEKELAQWPEIKWVSYHNESAFFQKSGLLFLDENDLKALLDYLKKARVQYSPFNLLNSQSAQGDGDALSLLGDTPKAMDIWKKKLRTAVPKADQPYLLSDDGQVLALTLRPFLEGSNLTQTTALYKKIQKLVAQKKQELKLNYVNTYYGGSMWNRITTVDVVRRDLSLGTIVSLTLLLLLNLFYFRSLKLVFIAFLPLLIGLTIGFAIVEQLFSELNLISSFLFSIMMGIGIDYSLHLLSRYLLEKKSGAGVQAAVLKTWLTTGRGTITSGLTIACAFAVMMITHFQGFAQFGAITAITAFVVFMTIFFMLPSLIFLLEKYSPVNQPRWGFGNQLSFAFLTNQRMRYAALALVALIPLGIYGVTTIKFNYDFRSVEVDLNQFRHKGRATTSVALGSQSSTPGAIVLAPTIDDLSALHGRILQYKEQDQSSPTIGKVISLADLIGPVSQRKRELISEIEENLKPHVIAGVKDPQWKLLLKDLRQAAKQTTLPTIEELPPVLKEQLFTQDEQRSYIIALYPNAERKDARHAMAFYHDLQNIAKNDPAMKPAGDMLVQAAVVEMVLAEGRWVIFFVFLVIITIVMLDFRSIRKTIWVVCPLIAGVLLLKPLMELFGSHLNFFNLTVLASLLGVGIDNGIHFVHAVDEYEGHPNPVIESIKQTFSPIVLCTLTNMIGYAGMLLAHHQGLYHIALLACLGLTAILIATFVVLPPLMQRFGK